MNEMDDANEMDNANEMSFLSIETKSDAHLSIIVSLHLKTFKHGVRHLLAAYDLQEGRLTSHIKKLKRHQILGVLEKCAEPVSGRRKKYIVIGNYKPHLNLKVQEWGKRITFGFLLHG